MASKKKIKMDGWAWASVVLAIALISFICYDQFYRKPSTKYSHNSLTEINISADIYAMAYRNNSIAADAVYLGKPLTVTGQVARIGKDANNKIYIALHIDTGDDVYCYTSDENFAMQLQPGSQISFAGTGGGNSIVGPIINSK